jgi:hypothetical protein
VRTVMERVYRATACAHDADAGERRARLACAPQPVTPVP